MITKKQYEQMCAQRRTPAPRLEYNMDGPAHAQVASEVDVQKERELMLARRAFEDAHRDMRMDYSIARREGQPSAHFNNPKPRMKP